MKQREKKLLCREIETYFRDVEHEMRIDDFDGFLFVSVSYEDFYTEEQVREDLSGISPCVVVKQIERYYSQKAVENAMGLMASLWLDQRQVIGGVPDLYQSPLWANRPRERPTVQTNDKSSTYLKEALL